MNRIALFGGTTEGRELAVRLKGLPVELIVCVATGYGKELLREELLNGSHGTKELLPDIRSGRMNENEMKEFLQNEEVSLVLDATHPYAEAVTENLENACKSKGVDYLRVLRDLEEKENVQEILQDQTAAVRVASIAEAVRFLEEKDGNILIATGSKELQEYTKLKDYEKRCYARVLSTKEAVEKSIALGFQGAHLIAMQGPFSREMNAALLRQVQASWFVTKESGAAGGFAEKAAAAKECGAVLVQIERPRQGGGLTVEKAAAWIREEWMQKNGGQKNGIQKKWLQENSAVQNQPVCLSTEVKLIGIGPGGSTQMTGEAQEALREAELVCGAGRMLAQAGQTGLTVKEAYRPEDILKALKKPGCYRKAVVLLSGDVSFFSGAKKLAEALESSGYSVEMLPGVSSVSCLAAKIKKEVSGAACVSLHGRSCNVAAQVRRCGRVFLLIDKAETIKKLCKELCDFGMHQVHVWIGSRLSYPDEKIYSGSAEEFAGKVSGPKDLSVVYLEDPDFKPAEAGFGIADEEFIRGKIPMTKAEVRCLAVSKLRLTTDAVVYDIGAGTGSVAVEAARAAEDGQVFAVEREPEGTALIEANRKKFALSNLYVIQGEAPEVLVNKEDTAEELPVPTHVFIGGSGGKLDAVLDYVCRKNPQVRIVVNAITPETLGACLAYEKKHGGLEAEIIQVQCARSRTAGTSHLMMGMNPVWIICLHRKE